MHLCLRHVADYEERRMARLQRLRGVIYSEMSCCRIVYATASAVALMPVTV